MLVALALLDVLIAQIGFYLFVEDCALHVLFVLE
jgi:hypothetical protein